MKRAIAISFLMLANMIILAHAIVPHHHHNQIPVACAVAHDEHDTNSDEHGNFEDCLLFKTLVKVNYEKQTRQFTSFDFVALPLFSAYSTLFTVESQGLPFRQKPYSISCFTEYISQSLGLRAPPLADFLRLF